MKVIMLKSGFHYVIRPWFRITENGVLVRLADFYDNYCGDHEVIEVSKEVFECMMSAYLEEKRFLMSVDRHYILTSFDEMMTGEMLNMVSDAADDEFFSRSERQLLRYAMKKIDPTLSRRIYLRYFKNMSLCDIACMEGVTPAAISTSLRRGVDALRKIMCNSDDRNTDS